MPRKHCANDIVNNNNNNNTNEQLRTYRHKSARRTAENKLHLDMKMHANHFFPIVSPQKRTDRNSNRVSESCF